jgi:hypothetical protein
MTKTSNDHLERLFLQFNSREAINIITRFNGNALQTLKTTISAKSANS